MEEVLERGDLDQVNELEMRLWVDGTGRTSDQVTPGVRERVREMNAAILAREGANNQGTVANRLDPPAIGRLGEITVPTLVIVGAHDVPDTLESAERLATARRLRDAGITVRLHIAPALPATDDFIDAAARVADWVWLDWPGHIRPAWTMHYRALGLDEWLQPHHIEQEAQRWRHALGNDRVKAGRDWFAHRFKHREVSMPSAEAAHRASSAGGRV